MSASHTANGHNNNAAKQKLPDTKAKENVLKRSGKFSGNTNNDAKNSGLNSDSNSSQDKTSGSSSPQKDGA